MTNEANFNKNQWNNHFIQKADAIGRQIATRAELDRQRNQVDGSPRSYIREGTVLIQDTLGATPSEIRLNQPRPQPQPAEVKFKVFTELFFSMKKMINYIHLHRLNVFKSTGPIAGKLLSNPRLTPVLSSPPTPAELDKLYDQQFDLLVGLGTSNKFLEQTSSPLPNSANRSEFKRRHNVANLANLMIESMNRKGLDDESISNVRGRDQREIETTVVPDSNQTNLEKTCLQASLS